MTPADFKRWTPSGLDVLRRVLAEAKRQHESKRLGDRLADRVRSDGAIVELQGKSLRGVA